MTGRIFLVPRPFFDSLQDSKVPLHKAVNMDHVESVRLLLDRGADMEAKDKVCREIVDCWGVWCYSECEGS